MKKILFAALAATTLFAACNKENGNRPDNGETKNVYLKVERTPGVRSVADAVSDYTVEFSSGELFFVDASGNITKHFPITTAATSTTNLNIAELTGATGINGIEVPATSKDVYVIANVPTGVTLPTAGAYSAVEDVIITAASQVGTITAGKAIEGVMLYSDTPGTLAETSPGDGDWSATVEPMQIANRLEITDIKAKAGGHVESFTIDGIYVNYFYSQKEIGAAPVAADLVNYQSIASAYAAGQGLYTTAGVFYDEPVGADSDASLTVSPGAGKVWGYNLLAGDEIPHIVIKLSNITAETGYTAPAGGTGFVTVKGFKKASDLSAIDFATGGQVFTVEAGDLEFELKDITIVPEVQPIDVKVTVELTEWIPVGVKPEI